VVYTANHWAAERPAEISVVPFASLEIVLIPDRASPSLVGVLLSTGHTSEVHDYSIPEDCRNAAELTNTGAYSISDKRWLRPITTRKTG
jgi:hypothetical protein